MTHEDLREYFPHAHAIEPQPCPGGVVVPVDSFPDLVLDADHTLRERTVTLYRCEGCGHLIPVAESGLVLNDYAPQTRQE